MSPKPPRPTPAEREEMARLLSVPAERDLPGGRHHLLKDYVMREIQQNAESAEAKKPTTWLSYSRRSGRQRFGLRLALPAGLAAAVAGIALTALPAQTAAAYTLQDTSDGTVKLTIVNPGGKIDLDRLQAELDKLGVHSRVYAGDPDCRDSSASATPAPETSPSSLAPDASPSQPLAWDITFEDGKPVLSVRADKMPADQQLMVAFPLAKTDPSHAYSVITAGVMNNGEAPDCVPAAPRGAVEFHGATAPAS